MGKLTILGIGDHHATNIPGEIIKTYSLGSCVALILEHPPSQSYGMVHIALPDSNFGLPKATPKPGYYANTAVPCLLGELRTLAMTPTGFTKGIQAKMTGGASVFSSSHYDFQIGSRVVAKIEQILRDLRIPIVAAETGGTIARTVAVERDSGKVIVSSSNKDDWQL